MFQRPPRDLTGFMLPDDLGARLRQIGYRQEDTSDVTWLERYRLYTAVRDGVYRFVAADEEPRPQPLLVTGAYFHRSADADETVNSQLERRALASVITDLQGIAWRRLHPSRWQQLFIRHRVAITVAVAVAVLAGIIAYADSVSPRINVFGFVNALSARSGDLDEDSVSLLMVITKILFVLATTTVGYSIAYRIGIWRHPIMSVELSEKALRYYYGPEARRIIDELEQELGKAPVSASARAGAVVREAAEPVPWHGYDNFVSYEEFQTRLRLEAKRSARFGQPVSCLIITAEPAPGETKAIVDDTETSIRSACSPVIWHEIREIDTSALYGDTGFIILLPNTDAEGARTVETRLRTKVCSCDIGGRSVADAATIRTAVSSAISGQCTEWEELIREAESSLGPGRAPSHDASPTDSQ